MSSRTIDHPRYYTKRFMPVSLEELPFDVLFYVTSHLELDDIVSLAHTCRQLQTLLQENGVCKKAIEVRELALHICFSIDHWQARFGFTKEAILAKEQHISYTQAFSCIQDRRHAISNAIPFSARVIGQANDFLYRNGMLCMLEEGIIRTFDIHAQAEGITIDLFSIIDAGAGSSSYSPSFNDVKICLLYYNEDIITIHWQRRNLPNSDRIMAINTSPQASSRPRLLASEPLEFTSKIFARHTSHYLYYGTYSSVGSQGHYEWEIQGISLDKSNDQFNCLQLQGFYGTDIGSTIAFEIHKGYFYAVSNQTSFEVEEIDWTSFYHCIRFPINNPQTENVESNKKLWRRQHDEGVIHDSWTDLSLQIDESKDKLMIIEARREYQKSCSRQIRTYYISEFISGFQSPPSSEDGSPILEATTGPMLPWDDAFVQTLDATNNPNYAPPEPRFNWNFHPEMPLHSHPGRSFILARTKFRAYNYPCSSFFDLVEDDRCCNATSSPCLRLRIGSRRVAPIDLKDVDPQLLSPPALPADVAYRHSPVKMWPPPASRCPCSKRLHQILNPSLPSGPAYSTNITGALDERSLVYMIRPGRSYSGEDNALGVIINVNFNRGPIPPKATKDLSHEQPRCDSAWYWAPGACRSGTCH